LKLERLLAPARGIAAALLMFVASSATSLTSAAASTTRHDDPALQSTPALHAAVVHRVADEPRSQRRLSQGTDLPFVDAAPRALDHDRGTASPVGVERAVVARQVSRAYDATAPPAPQS